MSEVEEKQAVLVVDDEESLRLVIGGVLEDEGFPVTTAASAEEALEIFKETPFKLVVSDIVMPGMNGRELYRQLVRIYPEIKVLYTSGYTDDVIAEHGVLDEGIHFLQKPFTVKSLLAKVRETLDA